MRPEIFEQAIDRWRRHGNDVPCGVSERCIVRLEAEQGVTIPDDLRAFYRLADGSGGMDERDDLTVWPLDEIAPAYDDRDLFHFADVLVSSYELAIRLRGDPHGQISARSARGWVVASDSFTSFLERYLRDPDFVWGIG